MKGMQVKIIVFCSLLFTLCGCSTVKPGEHEQIKATVWRYNQLLVEGYKNLNMNPLQEVAVKELAEKHYFHMSALGEGGLRLDSAVKDISFQTVNMSKPGEVTVVTKEKWDFAHVNLKSGAKFAEEKDFLYEMRYTLNIKDGRWIITNIFTIGGTSTNVIIPWPEMDRKGAARRHEQQNFPAAAPAGRP